MTTVRIDPAGLEQRAAEFNGIIRNVDTVSEKVFLNRRMLMSYSGYGLAEVKERLEKTADSLKKCSEDLACEQTALKKVAEYAVNADREAYGIISGNEIGEFSDNVSNSSNSKNSYASYLINFIGWFNEQKDKIEETFWNYEKASGKIYKMVSKILKKSGISALDGIPIFDALDIAKYVNTLAKSLTDKKVTTDSLVNILNTSAGAFNGIKGIIENFYGVNFIKDAVPCKLIELAKTGDEKAVKAVQKITAAKGIASWMPAVGSLITAFVSGYDSYKEAKADGLITDKEKAVIGLEAGFDGLVAVGLAAMTLACPVAGAIVGLVYFLADMHFDFGKLYADKSLDNIDTAVKFMKNVKSKLNST